jgi:nucleotide-binding universal stress UspA family protein
LFTDVFRSIVVPLDGSSFGLQALPAALGLAGPAQAAVHLVYVQEPPLAPIGLPGEPVLEPHIASVLVAGMDRYLGELADRICARTRLKVSAAIRHGRAAEAIAAYAREAGADLIVLTTHGRGGLSRLWLGSVADELLRIAVIPLLAVRPARRSQGLGRERRFRHVLAPLDGSDLAEQALAPAVVTARLAKARLTLLRVVTPHLAIARPAPVTRLDRADLVRQRREAEDYLRGVAERLRQEGVPVTTRVVASGDPARAIIRSAAAGRADVIAMATHARGRLGRFLRGSVCDKVLRGASRTAVLLTRPRFAESDSTRLARS